MCVFLLAGCGSPVGATGSVDAYDQDVEDLAPPAQLGLTASQTIYPGHQWVLAAEGAAAWSEVHFALGTDGMGMGPCPPALEGACLDLAGSVIYLGSATADAWGNANLAVQLPEDLSSKDIWVQAATPGQTSAVFSAWIDDSCPTIDVFAIARQPSGGSNGVVDFIEPNGNVIKAAVEVGDGPHGIAFGSGVFAVANSYDDTVDLIDASGEIAHRDLWVGDFPERVAYGDGVFMVTNWNSASLGLVDPWGNVLRTDIWAAPSPISIAYGDGTFMVGNASHGTVTLLDSWGDEIRGDVWVGNSPMGVAFGDGVFVVSNQGDDCVDFLDSWGNVLIHNVFVGDGPRGVAYGDGVFAIVNQFDDTVTMLDSWGNTLRSGISVGDGPSEIAYAGGHFLVGNQWGATITMLDVWGDEILESPVDGVVALPVGAGQLDL